jgi:hypothetical protein
MGRVGVVVDPLPFEREPGASSVTIEETNADGRFQPDKTPADGGLGRLQFGGGAVETTHTNHLDENPEIIPIDLVRTEVFQIFRIRQFVHGCSPTRGIVAQRKTNRTGGFLVPRRKVHNI